MSKLQTHTEIIANIAIAVACLSIVGVLAARQFNPASNSRGPSRLEAGDEIKVDSVQWNTAEATLLLALNKDCSFCTASMPFYKTLAQSQSRVQLVALFPHDVETGSRYLRDHDVNIREVRSADFKALRIAGTPTLAIVDREGVVTRTWNGHLDEIRQREVRDAIDANATARR